MIPLVGGQGTDPLWTGPRNALTLAYRLAGLLASHHHARDLDRGRIDRRAELQVIAHHLDVGEHLEDVGGDGDLLHGIGQLAVLDPDAGSTHRVVAGHGVEAGTGNRRQVEPVLDRADDVLGGHIARLQIEVAQAAAVGFGTQLARRVAAHEVHGQAAAVDDGALAGGQAFAIKGLGAETAGHETVVDDGHLAGSHLLTELAHQEGALLVDGIAGSSTDELRDEPSGHLRIEDHRHFLRLDLARTEVTQGPLSRDLADFFRAAQTGERTAHRLPATGLHALVVLGHDLGAHRHVGRAVAADEAPGVGVDRVVRAVREARGATDLNARVVSERGCFHLHGQFDLALDGHLGDGVVAEKEVGRGSGQILGVGQAGEGVFLRVASHGDGVAHQLGERAPAQVRSGHGGGALTDEGPEAHRTALRTFQAFHLLEAHFGGDGVADLDGDVAVGGAEALGFSNDETSGVEQFVDLRLFHISSSRLVGAADGDVFDADGGHAHTRRNRLTRLAAVTHTAVERGVVADHGDLVQRLRTVADQSGALDLLGHLAVLDEVGAGGAEGEVAVGDVHLPAAEGGGIQSPLNGFDDLRRRGLAIVQEGVGHARHRSVAIGFATTVAGESHIHQGGVEPVLHVALEYALLDEDVAPGGRALIVDVERAAAARHRAVVDDGADVGSHLFAHQAGEGRDALAIEVAFQTVADRFVDEHTRPAGAEHQGHLASGGRFGGEHVDGIAGSRSGMLAVEVFGSQHVEGLTTTTAGGAGFAAGAVFGQAADVETHHRAMVHDQVAEGSGDDHGLVLGGHRHGDVFDAMVVAPGDGVALGQHRHLVGTRDGNRRALDGVEVVRRLVDSIGADSGDTGGVGADGTGDRGSALERGDIDVVGEAVADAIADDHAHTGAADQALAAALENLLVEAQGLGGAGLQIDVTVGELAVALEGHIENSFELGDGDAEQLFQSCGTCGFEMHS